VTVELDPDEFTWECLRQEGDRRDGGGWNSLDYALYQRRAIALTDQYSPFPFPFPFPFPVNSRRERA
jgi:hypothetical protein